MWNNYQAIKYQYFGHISSAQLWIGIVASSLFINVLALVFPLTLLQMYDRIIPNHSTDTLFMMVCIVAGAMCIEWVLRVGRAAVTAWTNARLEYQLAMGSFEHLMKTSLSDFEKEGFGAHLEKMSALNTLKDFFGGQAITTLLDFPFVLVYLGLIYMIGGWLVLAPLCVLGLFVCLAYLLGRHMRRTLQKKQAADDRRLSFIVETLTGIHTVKSMAMELLMQRRYERLQRSTAESDYDLSFSSTLTASSSSLLSHINMLSIVGAGCVMVVNGSMTVGGLAACTLLANRTLGPLEKAMSTWKRFQAIALAQKRMESLYELPCETRQNAPVLENIQGKIELRDVHFKPDNSERHILNGVNLTVARGETISIRGVGQSGKSTLLWLMMGLLKPQKGAVYIDDTDISSIRQHGLREQIGYLPQHGSLYEGTIMENITMFRGADYWQRGIDAAHLLGLDEDVYKLPQGFDTHIGNRSIDSMPNGLRQRICIARALVNEPRIILFDEANSAVDQAADVKLINVLKHLKGRCTLIIVSHRPSILNLADTTYQLVDGKLEKENLNDEQSRNIA
jgi:ATP-binding cassette, subfamily C, bacterial LapB